MTVIITGLQSFLGKTNSPQETNTANELRWQLTRPSSWNVKKSFD